MIVTAYVPGTRSRMPVNNKVLWQGLPSPAAWANLAMKPLRLFYRSICHGNFLVDNISDPKSTITVLDFEYTNYLSPSFLFKG